MTEGMKITSAMSAVSMEAAPRIPNDTTGRKGDMTRTRNPKKRTADVDNMAFAVISKALRTQI